MIFTRRRRPMRWGRLAAVLVGAVLVGAGGRALWSNGLFATTHTGFHGACKVAGTLPGVADIAIADDTAFISAAGGRGPTQQDGIYALSLDGGGKLTRLAGAPKDFHPRGIGLYASPNGQDLYLMAVNRHTAKSSGGRFSIDSFKIANPEAAPALQAQGMIEGGLLINPQDVAPTGPGTFYVANGTASKNFFVHLLQTYGVISGGDVLYFDGMSFRIVASGLYGTRSLALTPDGQHVIVGGLLSRNLRSFQRESFSGSLTEGNSLSLPAGPEKITLDAHGDLWVAGHANLSHWRGFAKDAAKPSSSQIFRITLDGGVPQASDEVYGNAGSQIGGASVAAYDGRHLLIGSTLDGRLLNCTAS